MERNTFKTDRRPWRMRKHSYSPYSEYLTHLRVTYGMTLHSGNRLPYFSITTQNGCDHDSIREVFPELAPLIRWHLCDQDGLPMHYIANGRYWWEIAVGLKEPDKYQKEDASIILARHVVSGIIPSDDNILALSIAVGKMDFITAGRLFVAWMEARKDALGVAFREDMERFGVELIDMTPPPEASE